MAELLDVSTEPVKPAQTNAPGSEPTSWMPLSEEQRNTAPEAIKNLLESKKWTSFDEVFNGYAELEKVLGKGEHIFKPESPESADNADDWKKYHLQITGISDASEYEYETDETVPFDDALIDKFRNFSKKIHLNKEQSASVVQFQREIIKEVQAAEVQAEEEAVATDEAEKEVTRKALIVKYGGEVAYQSKVVEARQIADDLGIYQILEKKGLTSDPEIIGMLTDIAEKVAEGVLSKDTPPEPKKNLLEELAEIKQSEAFKVKFHPKHKEIMVRFMALNQEIANQGLAPKRIQA